MASADKSRSGVEEVSHHRVSASASHSEGVSESFSDADDGSWHSPYGSSEGRPYDEYRFSNASDLEIGGASAEQHHRGSSSSSSSSSSTSSSSSSSKATATGATTRTTSVIGEIEKQAHVVVKVERDCRICHLSLEGSGGVPIELGCSCKDDLAASHKHCAEAWFKIRGNKTCEICGSVARNVVGANDAEVVEQFNETSSGTTTATPAPPPASETRSFWQGHRFLNFLLACMVFAFVISWLFHFNVPS
ncbi:hypothetical protein Scep_005522 [Stephania cephalantha]|uniref:RING-CH-type domain-containing protein n=1 Tax=Stephania cephalantha TaxID=152367 RepID=A0AAP0PWF9_9MAGN